MAHSISSFHYCVLYWNNKILTFFVSAFRITENMHNCGGPITITLGNGNVFAHTDLNMSFMHKFNMYNVMNTNSQTSSRDGCWWCWNNLRQYGRCYRRC